MRDQINFSQERKLGRGLSALIGDSGKNKKIEATSSNNSDSNNESVELIAMNKIIAGIYQPRVHFNEQLLVELSDSIRAHGVIQPIIVRKADNQDIYEIVAGERRFRASKMAGISKIPAIIKDIDNIQALEFAIIENVQRSDLTPIEEARGYKQLIEEFDYTQEQVGKKIGCSRSHIANILRLLSLPKEVQDMIDRKQISMGHAKAIMNRDDIVEIAYRIVNESLSVRDLEENKNELDNKISKKIEATPNNKKISTAKDLKTRELKSQYLRTVEENLSGAIGLKVKATYDPKKQKGKIIISYDDLEQVENLIKKIDRQ